MRKSLFVVSLLLIAFVSSLWAVEAEKTDQITPTAAKEIKPAIGTFSGSDTVYYADFETEGEWEVVQLGTTGPVFEWVTDKAHSPTHSWWVPDDVPMTEEDALPIETAIVSPSITIPADFNGVEPKVLDLQYYATVESPNTADGGSVYDVWQIEMETSYEGDNFWHTDTHMGYNGTSSWWCGDPALGTYDVNWRQELRTPVLDLSGAAGAVMLNFQNAPSSETAYDYCFLEISSNDGGTWEQLARWDEEHDPLEWVAESYDISAYATATTIVRWRFTSDGGYQSPNGWHIDDIEITDGTTQFLLDDGGDAATQLIPVEHPLSWVRLHYDYNDGSRLEDDWTLVDQLLIYNGSLDLRPYAGQTTRFRIRVSTDGYNRLGEAPGFGFYFDDFLISGQGASEIDGAVIGVGGLSGAAPDKPLNAKVFIENQGLTDLNGPILWYGSVKDENGVEVAKPVGRLDGVLAVGALVSVETLEPTRWVPEVPGIYTFEVVNLQVNQDGYTPNNALVGEDAPQFIVHGPPMTEIVFAEDFEGGANELADFPGWTVVNGGGDAATGENVNQWGFSPGFIYGAGPLLSWAWGDLVEGDEVLDETIISPTIDISHIGAHNTLNLDFYLYFRPGHASVGAPFGEQYSDVTVSYSVDGGTTWNDVFFWADDDSVWGDDLRYPPAPATTILTSVDLSEAVGNDSLLLKCNVTSENSYFVGCNWDEIVVYAGISKPSIKAVADVPEDQGKMVHVAFRGSWNDLLMGEEGTLPVMHYDIWRGDEYMTGAAGSFASFEELFNSVDHAPLNTTYYVEDNDLAWTHVASVPASDFKVYGAVVPTLKDGMDTPYLVLAKTPDPVMWAMSNIASGMSADNLAPAPPTGLAVDAEDTKNTITWEEAYSPVDDVKYYSVYRSVDDGEYELLVTTIDLSVIDSEVEIGKKYTYAVSATDYAGNESAKSNESSVVTSVERSTSAKPTEYALSQNYPNPFNPTTTIKYATPKAGNVALTIYNTKGQAIRTLYNGHQEAGYHKIVWNADVSAGIYFLEIRAAEFTKTIKMMLVK